MRLLIRCKGSMRMVAGRFFHLKLSSEKNSFFFFEHLCEPCVLPVTVLPVRSEGESAAYQEKGGSCFIGSKLESPSGN